MNYFNRFIPRYSQLAAKLHEQTSDKAPDWDDTCTSMWNTLKNELKNATMLFHPDFSKPFHVYSDASILAVGGVLQQENAHGDLAPVAFCARKLANAETSARRACGAPAQVTQDNLGNTGQ